MPVETTERRCDAWIEGLGDATATTSDVRSCNENRDVSRLAGGTLFGLSSYPSRRLVIRYFRYFVDEYLRSSSRTLSSAFPSSLRPEPSAPIPQKKSFGEFYTRDQRSEEILIIT